MEIGQLIGRLIRLINKLRNKGYREAYVDEHVRTNIAYQVRAMRLQRGWNQKKLATVMDKPQSVVCRIEDPDYGKLSVQTLLEIAAAFDVALIIQYVNFSEFLRRTRDVSPKMLEVDSFDEHQLSSSLSYFTVHKEEPVGTIIREQPRAAIARSYETAGRSALINVNVTAAVH